MSGLSIDRIRAVKVAAAAGLALLAISILPGLLRPPPPPAVPADVGFTPAETATAATGLSTQAPRTTRKGAVSSRRTRRRVNSRDARKGESRRRPPDARRGGPSAPSAPRTPTPVQPPAPTVTYTPPAPEPVPPPTAPVAVPPVSPTPTADGSQEFAPR